MGGGTVLFGSARPIRIMITAKAMQSEDCGSGVALWANLIVDGY